MVACRHRHGAALAAGIVLAIRVAGQAMPESSPRTPAPACVAAPPKSDSIMMMKRRLRQDASGSSSLDDSAARKNTPSGIKLGPAPSCTLQISSDCNLGRALAEHSAALASHQGACDYVICLDPDVHHLGGDVLHLDSSLNREDGGRVVWTSTKTDQPAVLSGGSRITKWMRCDDGVHCPGAEWHGVWVAAMSDMETPLQPSDLPVRQLWVEGRAASRAYTYGHSMELELDGNGFSSSWPLDKFAGWVENQVVLRWPAQTWSQWTDPRCVLVDVTPHVRGALLQVDPNCWKDVADMSQGQPPVPAFVDNTWNVPPRPGEFVSSPEYIFYRQPAWKGFAPPIDTWVPTQAQIVTGEGLYNHEFRNLQFRHATWRHLEQPGGQSTVSHKKEPVAAVELRHSHEVAFENCTFMNIGAAYALAIGYSSKQVRVQRNEFTALSGGAVKLGNVDDTRAITTNEDEFDEDIVFEDNRLEEIGLEFREASAVFAGYVRRTRIAQNTIMNIGYTAISLGWGWFTHVNGPQTFARDNHVRRNKIIGVMQGLNDGGCIYTLGPQPGSTVEGNYCHSNPADQTGFIYFDNGSRYFKATNNVNDHGAAPCVNLQGCCDQPALDISVSKMWCRNTAESRNGCAEHNCKIDDSTYVVVDSSAEWPPEAQAIIDASGASSYRLPSVPNLLV